MGHVVFAHSDHVRPKDWCSVRRRRSAPQSLRRCVVTTSTMKESPNEEANGVGFTYSTLAFSDSRFSIGSSITESGALFSRSGISHDERQASHALQFRCAQQRRISRQPL